MSAAPGFEVTSSPSCRCDTTKYFAKIGFTSGHSKKRSNTLHHAHPGPPNTKKTSLFSRFAEAKASSKTSFAGRSAAPTKFAAKNAVAKKRKREMLFIPPSYHRPQPCRDF